VNSIRRQLTRSLLLILIPLLGAGLTAIYFLVRSELIESFDQTLKTRAEAISTLVLLDGDRLTLNFSDKFMRGFDDDEAKEFYEIWDDRGNSVQVSESLGSSHLPNRVGDFKNPKVWALQLPGKQPGRALGVEFVPRGTIKDSTKANKARYHLVVAARSRGVDGELREILMVMALGGGLMIVLTILVVPLLLRSGLRPLERLAGEVEKVNAETLTLRLPEEKVPRELVVITARLNALFARLEEAFERERRVSAAMAHELRTPIAELRNLAECALKWPEARDPEADRDALAIARQMESMVTHMLTLARSETGQWKPDFEPVDLPRAVGQAWKPLEIPAALKNIQFAPELGPLTVMADPVLLSSILGNLLENAVEYSPAGSVIGVRLESNGAGFSLTVCNPAPDLAPQDLARFFERFWRKEKARSGGSHIGLGLSLAHAFAGILGWKMTPRLETGSLVITLAGPVAASTPG
jgi:signal transduction histidine kinase